MGRACQRGCQGEGDLKFLYSRQRREGKEKGKGLPVYVKVKGGRGVIGKLHLRQKEEGV